MSASNQRNMNRINPINPSNPPDDDDSNKTNINSGVSPEASVVKKFLVDAFCEAIQSVPMSPQDILVGTVEFLRESSELLTDNGVAPKNYRDCLAYNIDMNFDIDKSPLPEPLLHPILGEMAREHFAGNLGMS